MMQIVFTKQCGNFFKRVAQCDFQKLFPLSLLPGFNFGRAWRIRNLPKLFMGRRSGPV